ncbi:hypothetical protein [Frankia sp. R43]|uniref:hypothetical protein n=1 Tax=Frankia sp. R43 TaxID=269536 RepID=UPI000A795BA5|nr:hypothetical protein [Frankia sp. R43]
MFDVAGKLAVLPSSPSEMLGLLREVVEAWRGEAGNRVGCTSEELVAVQGRLGVQIPWPLGNFLGPNGIGRYLMNCQDPFLLPRSMRIEDNVLVIQEENQMCALWGISTQRLAELDPPVLFKGLNDVTGDWRPYHGRLSVHLFEAVLNELVISSKGSIFREVDEDSIDALTGSLIQVGIPRHPFWAEPEGAAVKWLAGAEILVRIDGDSIIWASAPLGYEARGVLNIVPEGWESVDS